MDESKFRTSSLNLVMVWTNKPSAWRNKSSSNPPSLKVGTPILLWLFQSSFNWLHSQKGMYMRSLKFIALLLVLGSFASAQELTSVEVTKGETRKGFDHWNLTVSLDKPAPEGGAEVSLAADPVTAAAVPATIVIPEGQLSFTTAVGANPLATEGSIYAN